MAPERFNLIPKHILTKGEVVLDEFHPQLGFHLRRQWFFYWNRSPFKIPQIQGG